MAVTILFRTYMAPSIIILFDDSRYNFKLRELHCLYETSTDSTRTELLERISLNSIYHVHKLQFATQIAPNYKCN